MHHAQDMVESILEDYPDLADTFDTELLNRPDKPGTRLSQPRSVVRLSQPRPRDHNFEAKVNQWRTEPDGLPKWKKRVQNQSFKAGKDPEQAWIDYLLTKTDETSKGVYLSPHKLEAARRELREMGVEPPANFAEMEKQLQEADPEYQRQKEVEDYERISSSVETMLDRIAETTLRKIAKVKEEHFGDLTSLLPDPARAAEISKLLAAGSFQRHDVKMTKEQYTEATTVDYMNRGHSLENALVLAAQDVYLTSKITVGRSKYPSESKAYRSFDKRKYAAEKLFEMNPKKWQGVAEGYGVKSAETARKNEIQQAIDSGEMKGAWTLTPEEKQTIADIGLEGWRKTLARIERLDDPTDAEMYEIMTTWASLGMAEEVDTISGEWERYDSDSLLDFVADMQQRVAEAHDLMVSGESWKLPEDWATDDSWRTDPDEEAGEGWKGGGDVRLSQP